jgi:hypothetical protein
MAKAARLVAAPSALTPANGGGHPAAATRPRAAVCAGGAAPCWEFQREPVGELAPHPARVSRWLLEEPCLDSAALRVGPLSVLASHHPAWQPRQAWIAAAGGADRSPPRTRTRRSINRAKRTTRPVRSTPPRGAMSSAVAGARPLLQVVADYTRFSAVRAAGYAGDRRASGSQYPGVSIGCITL